MPTILIRHPNGTVEERDVLGKLTVGCDDANDLVLRAGGVSQRHAAFFADGGELVLENVGSAAATLVDGEAIGQPTKLRAGVKVLIGEYEVTLKPDLAQMVVRKTGAAAVASTLTDEGPVPGSTPTNRVPWVIGATALVVVAVLAGTAVLLVRGPPGPPPVVVEVVDAVPRLPPAVGCDVEALLRPAREAPSDRALAAANAALDCDPLNQEAAGLKLDIEAELKGAAAADRGSRFVDLGHDAEGLAAFKEIPVRARSFVRTQPQAQLVAGRLEKAAAESCRKYAKEARWVQAASACEQAMNLRCQAMSPDELTPPITKSAGWKPKEPLLTMLLKAREKADPHAPAWSCPPTPILKPLLTAGGETKAAPVVARQSTDPQISAALGLYAKGNVGAAIIQLQEVKEKSQKAAVHAEADLLRTEMVAVESLEKIGKREFETGELDKGARSFRDALDADAKLMLAPGASPTDLDRQPSSLRRAIVATAAQEALRTGRPLAEHGDLKRACAAWRVGFSFYRGNTELNEALNRCSTAAKELLDAARGCPDLGRAGELAIPNDGLAEAIAARKAELRCP